MPRLGLSRLSVFREGICRKEDPATLFSRSGLRDRLVWGREGRAPGPARLYKALEQTENEHNLAHNNLASYEGVKASEGGEQHENTANKGF